MVNDWKVPAVTYIVMGIAHTYVAYHYLGSCILGSCVYMLASDWEEKKIIIGEKDLQREERIMKRRKFYDYW